MESFRVRLKLRYEGDIKTVAISSDASLIQLRKRLSVDYGFDMDLKYEDKEGDLITLRDQSDFETLMQSLAGSNSDDHFVNIIIIESQALPMLGGAGTGRSGSQNSYRQSPKTPTGVFPSSPSSSRSISSSRSDFRSQVHTPSSSISRSGSRPRLPSIDYTNGNSDGAPRAIRWKKGEMLGQGAFGVVCLGLNIDSGELMAVKQMSLDDVSAKELSTLENEIQLLGSLRHPNIVRYIGTEINPSNLSIFLEYVPGGSLKALISKFGQLEESVARSYTRQLLLGLEYLHRNGIAHRDIKGANCLVGNDGVIKLADFGNSKRWGPANASLSGGGSASGDIKGTPSWMAPEVIREQGSSTISWRKADVWSLACTTLEMATGRPPWAQFQNSVTILYHIACQDTLPDYPSPASVELITFLNVCLQRDPSKRPDITSLLLHPFVASMGVSGWTIATQGFAQRPSTVSTTPQGEWDNCSISSQRSRDESINGRYGSMGSALGMRSRNGSITSAGRQSPVFNRTRPDSPGVLHGLAHDEDVDVDIDLDTSLDGSEESGSLYHAPQLFPASNSLDSSNPEVTHPPAELGDMKYQSLTDHAAPGHAAVAPGNAVSGQPSGISGANAGATYAGDDYSLSSIGTYGPPKYEDQQLTQTDIMLARKAAGGDENAARFGVSTDRTRRNVKAKKFHAVDASSAHSGKSSGQASPKSHSADANFDASPSAQPARRSNNPYTGINPSLNPLSIPNSPIGRGPGMSYPSDNESPPHAKTRQSQTKREDDSVGVGASLQRNKASMQQKHQQLSVLRQHRQLTQAAVEASIQLSDDHLTTSLSHLQPKREESKSGIGNSYDENHRESSTKEPGIGNGVERIAYPAIARIPSDLNDANYLHENIPLAKIESFSPPSSPMMFFEPNSVSTADADPSLPFPVYGDSGGRMPRLSSFPTPASSQSLQSQASMQSQSSAHSLSSLQSQNSLQSLTYSRTIDPLSNSDTALPISRLAVLGRNDGRDRDQSDRATLVDSPLMLLGEPGASRSNPRILEIPRPSPLNLDIMGDSDWGRSDASLQNTVMEPISPIARNIVRPMVNRGYGGYDGSTGMGGTGMGGTGIGQSGSHYNVSEYPNSSAFSPMPSLANTPSSPTNGLSAGLKKKDRSRRMIAAVYVDNDSADIYGSTNGVSMGATGILTHSVSGSSIGLRERDKFRRSLSGRLKHDPDASGSMRDGYRDSSQSQSGTRIPYDKNYRDSMIPSNTAATDGDTSVGTGVSLNNDRGQSGRRKHVNSASRKPDFRLDSPSVQVPLFPPTASTPLTPLTVCTPLSASYMDNESEFDRSLDESDQGDDCLHPMFLSPAVSLDEHTAAISRLRVPRKTRLLVSSSLDGTVRIWRPGEVESRAVLDTAMFSLSDSQAQRDRRGGGSATGLIGQPIQFAKKGQSALTEAYDGNECVGGTGMGGTGSRARLTNLWVQEGCETIWAAATDNALRIWGGIEGKAIRYLPGHEDSITAMEGIGGQGGAGQGCLVGTASVDKTVRIWDARSKRAQVFLFKGHSDTVLALRWGEGGRSVVSAGKDKTIRIWDTRAGRQRIAIEKHFGAVNALRAIPEGLQCNALKSGESASFASGGRDAVISLWSATGDCVGTQAAHRGAVNFLSDINCSIAHRGLLGLPVMFSLGGDSTIKLWELRKLKLCGEIQLDKQCSKGVWAGTSIVTSGPTGNVTCWNYAKDGRSVGALDGSFSQSKEGGLNRWIGRELSCHNAACSDLISTESMLASGAKNGQILVWG